MLLAQQTQPAVNNVDPAQQTTSAPEATIPAQQTQPEVKNAAPAQQTTPTVEVSIPAQQSQPAAGDKRSAQQPLLAVDDSKAQPQRRQTFGTSTAAVSTPVPVQGPQVDADKEPSRRDTAASDARPDGQQSQTGTEAQPAALAGILPATPAGVLPIIPAVVPVTFAPRASAVTSGTPASAVVPPAAVSTAAIPASAGVQAMPSQGPATWTVGDLSAMPVASMAMPDAQASTQALPTVPVTEFARPLTPLITGQSMPHALPTASMSPLAQALSERVLDGMMQESAFASASALQNADPQPLLSTSTASASVREKGDATLPDMTPAVQKREIRSSERATQPQPSAAQLNLAQPPADIVTGRVSSADPVAQAQVAPREPVQPRQLIEQIVTTARLEIAGNRHELTVRLDPPDLGVIHVKVSAAENGAMTVRLEASSATVRDALDARLQELRRSFTDAGIDVGDCSVSLGMQTSSGQSQFTDFGRQGRPQGLPTSYPEAPNDAPAAAPVAAPSRHDGALDVLM